MSLIEQIDEKDTILYRIMRVMPLKMLKKNLTRIYNLFKELYKNKYTMDVFEWYDKDFTSKINPKFYECIIENGFNIFILINTFLEKGSENKNEDIKEYANEINLLDPNKGIFTGCGRVISSVYFFFKNIIVGLLCCGYCRKKTKNISDEFDSDKEDKMTKEAL